MASRQGAYFGNAGVSGARSARGCGSSMRVDGGFCEPTALRPRGSDAGGGGGGDECGGGSPVMAEVEEQQQFTPTRDARSHFLMDTPAKARPSTLAPRKHQRTNHRHANPHAALRESSGAHGEGGGASLQFQQHSSIPSHLASCSSSQSTTRNMVMNYNQALQEAAAVNTRGASGFTSKSTTSMPHPLHRGSALSTATQLQQSSFGHRRGSCDSLGCSMERNMDALRATSGTPLASMQGSALFATPLSPQANSFGFGAGCSNGGGWGGGNGTTSRGMSPQFLHSGLGLRSSIASHAHTDHSALSQDTTLSQFLNRRVVQDFVDVCELGRGNFGAVMLMQEKFSGDYFAIKALPPFQGVRDRQCKLRERAVLAAVRGFPHCIQLYNAWIDGQRQHTLHLQLQLCPNGNVSDEIGRRRAEGRQWREDEVRTFLGQMAIALDALHSANIVHVDVKPDNIMIDEKRNYVLSDFGLALMLDPTTGRPTTYAPSLSSAAAGGGSGGGGGNVAMSSLSSSGRPQPPLAFDSDAAHSIDVAMSQDEGDCRYMSRDMLNEKGFFKAGDVFALGISCYELMSGMPLPKAGPEYDYLRSRTDLHELEASGYSEELLQVVLAMLQADPSARPTARDILESTLFRPNEYSFRILTQPLHHWEEHCASELDPAAAAATHSQGSIDTALVRCHATCFEVANYLLQQITLRVNRIPPSPHDALTAIVNDHLVSRNCPVPRAERDDEEGEDCGNGGGVRHGAASSGGGHHHHHHHHDDDDVDENGSSARPSTSTTCAWGAGSAHASPELQGMSTPVSRTLK